MRIKFTLILAFAAFSLIAQKRYIDPSFEVETVANVIYGNNISILTGTPAAEDLFMDIYMPKDDSITNRPVMLIAHTGSFLPPIINGQATGSKSDASVVHVCTELAKRGYVAIAYSYRFGWVPISPEQDVRTGTLLQAAYRGIQDTRSCVRFLRAGEESNNPYGIDPDKIGVMGLGTGSYLSYGAGSLYDFSEIQLEKFISTTTAENYIDSLVFGNIYGDTNAQLCTANTPGYSSEVAFAFNLGGACGDGSWIDGDEQEAAFAGCHATNDIFAPYTEGPVIVPTTNEFVVNVAGSRAAISYANERGNNDVFNSLNADIDPLNDRIQSQKETDLALYTGQTLKMGTDNFYAFETPFPEGSPWDWWDYNILSATVDFINSQTGGDYNADTIHMSGLATNKDMSPEKGMRYIDTAFMLMIPRACLALDLGCNLTNTEDVLTVNDVNLTIAPNPASLGVRLETASEYPIQGLRIYNITGEYLGSKTNINSNSYYLERNHLNTGTYLVQMIFEEGTLTQKIVFD